ARAGSDSSVQWRLMMKRASIINCPVFLMFILSLSLTGARANFTGSGEPVKVNVGDPIVNGSFIKPYKNMWRLTVELPDGSARDMGAWSDETEKVQLDGRAVLKRTQISRRPGGAVMMVNIFDPRTMSPISTDNGAATDDGKLDS